jgi:predicted metalloprotease
MTSSRPRLVAGAAAVLLAGLALSACGDDSSASAEDPETVFTTVTRSPTEPTTPTDPTTTDTTETTGPTESMTIEPTGKVDPEELAEDVDAAVTVTDRYWTDHWNDFFTGSYTPPTVVGLYDGYDEANAPTCFGEPLPPGNAFYCPDGDFVAWDQTLIELGYEVGDAWPYLIVAHEWGHAVQARLSMNLQSEQYELQADCLAGATLYGSAADGNLEFESGDEKEIVDGLNLIADEVPWGMTGDHGDSFQRIDAFNAGRTGGVPECLPEVVKDKKKG